jgi:hypothetical protein
MAEHEYGHGVSPLGAVATAEIPHAAGVTPRPSVVVVSDPSRYARVGDIVHFFPASQKGFSDREVNYQPMAAIILALHPSDPRIARCLAIWSPLGAVNSYENIPHRSLTPSVLPVEGWLGHALAPQSHWEFIR